jgi:hypothetical protein
MGTTARAHHPWTSLVVVFSASSAVLWGALAIYIVR